MVVTLNICINILCSTLNYHLDVVQTSGIHYSNDTPLYRIVIVHTAALMGPLINHVVL